MLALLVGIGPGSRVNSRSIQIAYFHGVITRLRISAAGTGGVPRGSNTPHPPPPPPVLSRNSECMQSWN